MSKQSLYSLQSEPKVRLRLELPVTVYNLLSDLAEMENQSPEEEAMDMILSLIASNLDTAGWIDPDAACRLREKYNVEVREESQTV